MTGRAAARATPADGPTTEQERLATLLQITDALSSTLNTRAALQVVLETLARRHAIPQSLVVRLEEDGRQLHVDAAYGLNRPAHHIHYTLGEGVIGTVVETGKAVIVPRVSREPSLVLRNAGREDAPGEESSFICVPIGVDRRVVGALGVNLKFKSDRNYERSKAFYSVVASMIGQALKVQRLVAAQHKRLVNENAHLKQELRERYDFAGIVGNSGPMQRVYEQVAQVARTNTTVLLRGESGTGKELIASAIHYNSARAKKPFVKVSCGALPDTLIESELFGYEKGAFTGADARKKGRFELAEGGTLFLDEIGDVQLSTQVKLLRVLQEREFERLGGHETLKSDVRLIAATNKDLERAIEKGSFREDLFYRLNVFPIFIPPLRERKPDVLLLADHFLQRYSAEHGKRHPPPRDAGDRHADVLPLAGQRPRAAERHRARRAGLRRARHPRPSPPADAADRGGVRHGDEHRARRCGGRLREGSAAGRAEERPREPRQGGAAAAHDRAHRQLQGAQARHRLEALQAVAPRRRVRRPCRPSGASPPPGWPTTAAARRPAGRRGARGCGSRGGAPPAARSRSAARRRRPTASSSMSAWISALAPTSTPRVGSSRISMRAVGREPLGEHHLLLVAARQPGRDGVARRRPHAQPLESTPAPARARRRARTNGQRATARRSVGSVTLLQRRSSTSTSPWRLRSSGTRPMPARIASLGRSTATRLRRARRSAPVAAGVQTEQRLRDLGSPGADQPGEPDHLAGPQR